MSSVSWSRGVDGVGCALPHGLSIEIAEIGIVALPPGRRAIAGERSSRFGVRERFLRLSLLRSCPKAAVRWNRGKAVAVGQLSPIQIEIFMDFKVINVILMQIGANILIDFQVG